MAFMDLNHTPQKYFALYLTVSYIFRPLRKMATGMILAALAFCAATIVEVNVIVRFIQIFLTHNAYRIFESTCLYALNILDHGCQII